MDTLIVVIEQIHELINVIVFETENNDVLWTNNWRVVFASC